ncbi:MAG: hypothetical protein EAX89_15310 [Candidatus Lokiarchaeota archaeon]|nr:hypothetical protein [Candidatus Lokiarchaeota archaeon]
MVFKNINRIKSALPEVKHIVMFYNNGTIFQTTFEQSINIPKLGENLAGTLNHIRSLYEICNYKMEPYKKLIFETEDMSVIILKLGEESNIALFFEKEQDRELRLTAVRRYISNIETLIDMDEKELILKEILTKEDELKKLSAELQKKRELIESFKSNLLEFVPKELETKQNDLKNTIIATEQECSDLEQKINLFKIDIEKLKTTIQKVQEQKLI